MMLGIISLVTIGVAVAATTVYMAVQLRKLRAQDASLADRLATNDAEHKKKLESLGVALQTYSSQTAADAAQKAQHIAGRVGQLQRHHTDLVQDAKIIAQKTAVAGAGLTQMESQLQRDVDRLDSGAKASKTRADEVDVRIATMSRDFKRFVRENDTWHNSTEASLQDAVSQVDDLNASHGGLKRRVDSLLLWNADGRVSVRQDLDVQKNMNVSGRIHFKDPKMTTTGTMENQADPFYLEKRNAGPKSELRLTINDDQDDSFQIWGNSCKAGNCNGEGKPMHVFMANGEVRHAGGLSLDRGVSVTAFDPGPLVEKRYGNQLHDRYGVGQFTGGTTRVYAAGDNHGGASVNLSLAEKDGRFTDIVKVHRGGATNKPKVTVAGNLDVSGRLSVKDRVCRNATTSWTTDFANHNLGCSNSENLTRWQLRKNDNQYQYDYTCCA